MSWTQSDLHAVERAIATGARRVRFSQPGGGTREIEYQTTAELLSLRDTIRAALGLLKSGGFGVSYPRTGKGIL